jgi:hypothetical protein
MPGINSLIRVAGKYIFVVLTEPSGADFTFYLRDDEEGGLIRQIFDETSGGTNASPVSRPSDPDPTNPINLVKVGPPRGVVRPDEENYSGPYSYSGRIYLLRPWLEEKDLKLDKTTGGPNLLLRLDSAIGAPGDPHYDNIKSCLPRTCAALASAVASGKRCVTTLISELNSLLRVGKLPRFGTRALQAEEQLILDQITDASAHERLKAYLQLCSLLGDDDLKPVASRLRCGRVLASLSYERKVWSVSFREQEAEPGYESSTKLQTNLNSIAEIATSLYEEIFFVVSESESAARGHSSDPTTRTYADYTARIQDHRTAKLGELSGLIVISGSTNSAKSLIARGLIDLYLENTKAGGHLKRRPHLVTFEDPIEKYFASDACLPSNSHPQLQVQMGAAAKGIDYTPRQLRQDVQGLPEALREALRQTPRVLFVGETRERIDWRALVDFASTGHLIITTAHAGSLVESMHKIFSFTNAKTSSDRAEIAGRLLAVVHLKRAELSDPKYSVLVPALWRRVPKGVNALTADGLASVLPHSHSDEDDPCSCLGRKYFIERLLEFSQSRLSGRKISKLKTQLRLQAIDWDLRGA